MEARWSWVALWQLPEVAYDVRCQDALAALGEPRAILEISSRELAARVGDRAASAIGRLDVARAAAAQRDAARRTGARLVLMGDDDYPASLAVVDRPPRFLLVQGALGREDLLAIAIVGSRRATAYGCGVAARLGEDLGARGVTIVSGLARGIDTAAHRGALRAGGRTIAVLGSGVDVAYPPENRHLLGDIARSGAVVSQFPMGTAPLPQHFPIRNRTIAALALGTVVVEAAERSGALITARCAAELGREVYAVPGNVSSPVSAGTLGLIQDGAKLVRGWGDVVAEWPPAWRRALRPVAGPPDGSPLVDDPREGRILALLGDEPLTMDSVVAHSGLPSGQVAAGLMTLELRGLVRQMAGQRYVRA
jgi:DNA processing protein